MSVKFFLDTNILVYSCDNAYPEKKEKAKRLITEAFEKNTGVISFQVVQEFLNVVTRKFLKVFSAEEAKFHLEEVLRPLCEVFPSIELYRQALEIQKDTGLGFYDSLIIAAADDAGCKILYSEDFQSGQKIRGLTIQNPF